MNVRGTYTLFYKEILRFSKVALQTLAAPMITALLYLLVFAHVLASRLQPLPGVPYTAFLVPGLMMMSIIQNSFANSSSSVIQSKVTGNLIFILIAPLAPLEILMAFVLAAAVRGLAVGCGLYLVTLPFVHLPLAHPGVLLLMAFLSSAALATLGLIAAIWAEKFDQLAAFQNFLIMPLSFLSGVFYSIHSLPAVWRQLSHFNPFFYMIDSFRYGFFGVADVSPARSLGVVALTFAVLSLLTLEMLRRGYKLRD